MMLELKDRAPPLLAKGDTLGVFELCLGTFLSWQIGDLVLLLPTQVEMALPRLRPQVPSQQRPAAGTLSRSRG